MALPSSNLFRRDDTLLGICEGLGQDLGVNPLWIRLAFLPFLFVFPAYTIGAYLVIGLLVWASRSLFPSPASQSANDGAADAACANAAEPSARKASGDYSLAA